MSKYLKFIRLEIDNVRDNYASIHLEFELQDLTVVRVSDSLPLVTEWEKPNRITSIEQSSKLRLTCDRVSATTNQLLEAVL